MKLKKNLATIMAIIGIIWSLFLGFQLIYSAPVNVANFTFHGTLLITEIVLIFVNSILLFFPKLLVLPIVISVITIFLALDLWWNIFSIITLVVMIIILFLKLK